MEKVVQLRATKYIELVKLYIFFDVLKHWLIMFCIMHNYIQVLFYVYIIYFFNIANIVKRTITYCKKIKIGILNF